MSSTNKVGKRSKGPNPGVSDYLTKVTGTNFGAKKAMASAKKDVKAGRSSDHAKSKTKKDTSRLKVGK